MRVLCRDRRGQLGTIWWDNCPAHVPAHGHPIRIKCPSKIVLNSHFSTFITRSSFCRALRAIDSITIAIKLATCKHSTSSQLCLLLSMHASHSSFRSLVLRPTQPYLNLPMTFSGGSVSSPVLLSTPSLSCTFFPLCVMLRHHRM